MGALIDRLLSESFRSRRASRPPDGGRLRPRLVGPLGGRLSFSLALVGLAIGLTVLTGAMLGALAWQEKRAFSQELLDGAMARTGRLAATQVERFLRDAESAARLGPEMVAQGLLDPLPPTPSSASRWPRFVRTPTSRGRATAAATTTSSAPGGTPRKIYVNRSWPIGPRIHLKEDRVLADGRRSRPALGRPRLPPPRAAVLPLAERSAPSRGPSPTSLLGRWAGDQLRRPAARRVRRGAGRLHGRPLAGRPGGVPRRPPGLAARPRLRGDCRRKLVIGPRDVIETGPGACARARRPDGRARRPGARDVLALDHEGERLLGRSVPLVVGETPWRFSSSVPERDYTAPVDALARRTLGLGLLGLALVATGGVIAARRLSWPLRRLAAHAMRDRPAPSRCSWPRGPPGRDRHARALAPPGGPDPPGPRPGQRAPGAYVNPELAQRWLKERRTPRLGGEPREVAILMSDLRGFSALSEQLGPEAVFSVLNRYLGRMTEVIHAHGGAINEFIGDGILVLFGAPTARPTTPRARCAARGRCRRRSLSSTRRPRAGHPELRMGIGLNAGIVVAGHIGGRDRAAYTVVGPVVNRTARMVDLAGRTRSCSPTSCSRTCGTRSRSARRAGPPSRACPTR